MDRLLALADCWGSQFVEASVAADASQTNRHATLDAPGMRLLAFLPLLREPATGRRIGIEINDPPKVRL